MSLSDRPENASRYQRSIETFLKNSEGNSDFVERCFWELKNSYDSYGKKMSRWIIFGLAFACVFELLNRHLVSKASISGIDITRLDFLLYLLPPLVAFAFLNLVTFNLEQNVYDRLLGEFARQRFPGLNKSNIMDLFISQQGLFPSYLPKGLVSARAGVANQLNLAVQFFSIPVCYIAFEIYAYIQLFTHSQTSVAGAVLSLIGTACLSAIAAVTVFNEELIQIPVPTGNPPMGS